MLTPRHRVTDRVYDQCIREVEHGCISPLVFSVSGVMGPTDKVVYKMLASMIAAKHKSHSQVINCLCCMLSFTLLCFLIMCINKGVTFFCKPPGPSSIGYWTCPLREQSSLRMNTTLTYVVPNHPGMSGTLPDFLPLSRKGQGPS